MSFLKTLGSYIAKGLQIVLGFAPLIESSFPNQAATIAANVDRLRLIADIIVRTEAVGQALSLTGPQKLIAASPDIEQAILSSSILAGHAIADPVKFKAAVSGIASNMADLLNSLSPDAILTQNKTAAPLPPA